MERPKLVCRGGRATLQSALSSFYPTTLEADTIPTDSVPTDAIPTIPSQDDPVTAFIVAPR